MRDVYGTMTLKKGSTLYHASNAPFAPSPTKPLLFTTFQPSDHSDTYITRIILQRDTHLVFLVNEIVGSKILPVLDTLMQQPGRNMDKQYEPNQICYARHLKREGVDGWLSTINGYTPVEVALLNDPSLFSAMAPSENYHSNYNSDGNISVSKRTRYPISIAGATLRVHKRMQGRLEQYMATCEQNRPGKVPFQCALKATDIEYYDGPIGYVSWEC